MMKCIDSLDLCLIKTLCGLNSEKSSNHLFVHIKYIRTYTYRLYLCLCVCMYIWRSNTLLQFHEIESKTFLYYWISLLIILSCTSIYWSCWLISIWRMEEHIWSVDLLDYVVLRFKTKIWINSHGVIE